MFCYQCQETGSGKGCTGLGVCGKTDETANLQDLLIWLLKGLSLYASSMVEKRTAGVLAAECLFATVTNTNFDSARIIAYAKKVIALRENLREVAASTIVDLPDSATWNPSTTADFLRKSLDIGILQTADPALRSLREIITYALKGMSAYTYHAAALNFYDDAIFDFMFRALDAAARETNKDLLMGMVLETGKFTLAAMDLLDRANTVVYGEPEPVKIRTGVGTRPGILVSGHELKDLEMLLDQTRDAGVDVYTNGEMILAHSLPFFRKYLHLVGNYGNAWWQQTTEFARFNGAILVTSNCIVPVEPAYAGRIFTSSVAGYPGVPHIASLPASDEIHEISGKKDFSAVIERAKQCPPPESLNEPDFWHGFGHGYLATHKKKILDLIERGKIKKFVVMAGCDGRDMRRSYYTKKALSLPEDTIILTAGCAKYRYIKEISSTIEGIPRVLDAGQCSDTFSLIEFARELARTLHITDLNTLPIEYDIAWYDQKAIAIFLALLYLGIKTIKVGPTLPEYFQQYIAQHLPPDFHISTIHKD
jgi:hydroxylamine reductase